MSAAALRSLTAALMLLLAGQAAADWKAPREALDQRHVCGIYRIHYTLSGPHALPAEAGADLANRLCAQFARADRLYAERFGLTPPLANARYRQVRAIDVHLLELPGKSGSTGDEPIVYRYRQHADPLPALTIAITRHWQPGALTPEHEVFHAYQYGYTYFKNAWFLEGLARSMEGGFGGSTRAEPLPRDTAGMERLLGLSYRAAPFWNRLRQRCDPGCADDTACGGHVVRRLLEELRQSDRAAAKARGIDPDNWPEDEQRADRNTPWMLAALMRTLEAVCPVATDGELNGLLKALKAMPPPEGGRTPPF